MKKLYDLLGIPEDASRKEIESAWKKKCFELHPDRQPPELRDEYTRQFQEIQQAYRILTDLDERLKYLKKKKKNPKCFRWSCESTYMGQPFSGELTIMPDSLEYKIIFSDDICRNTLEDPMFSIIYNGLSAGSNMEAELATLLKAIILELRPPQIEKQLAPFRDYINRNRINYLDENKKKPDGSTKWGKGSITDVMA
jgi:curved DNA-binding protein CbpA